MKLWEGKAVTTEGETAVWGDKNQGTFLSFLYFFQPTPHFTWGMKLLRDKLLPFTFSFCLKYSSLNQEIRLTVFIYLEVDWKFNRKLYFNTIWSWFFSMGRVSHILFWVLYARSTICCNHIHIHANPSKPVYSRDTDKHTLPPPRNLSRLSSSSYV